MRQIEDTMFDPNSACDYCAQGATGFDYVFILFLGGCVGWLLGNVQLLFLPILVDAWRILRWRRRGGMAQYDDRKHVDKVNKVDPT